MNAATRCTAGYSPPRRGPFPKLLWADLFCVSLCNRSTSASDTDVASLVCVFSCLLLHIMWINMLLVSFFWTRCTCMLASKWIPHKTLSGVVVSAVRCQTGAKTQTRHLIFGWLTQSANTISTWQDWSSSLRCTVHCRPSQRGTHRYRGLLQSTHPWPACCRRCCWSAEASSPWCCCLWPSHTSVGRRRPPTSRPLCPRRTPSSMTSAAQRLPRQRQVRWRGIPRIIIGASFTQTKKLYSPRNERCRKTEGTDVQSRLWIRSSATAEIVRDSNLTSIFSRSWDITPSLYGLQFNL